MNPSGHNPNLLKLLVLLWGHLSRRRRIQFLFLTVLMILSAFAEIISLGTVLPFLGALTSPQLILKHPMAQRFAYFFGIHTANQMVVPLTIAFASAALLSGAVRILLFWFSNRLAFASSSDLSTEMYRRTLYQPYQVHLARNPGDIIRGILLKANAIAFGVLLQLFVLLSSVLLQAVIILTLIAINPKVALGIIFSFGTSYGFIVWLSRRKLARDSQRIEYEEGQVVRALQESLGGIRDVLLHSLQDFYCEIHRQSERPWRQAQGSINFISASPRFAMEALGMILFAALAFVLNQKEGGLTSSLPLLGALALGAQRILPALHQSFNAWASIAGNQFALEDTLKFLGQPLPTVIQTTDLAPVSLQNEIRFSSVSFRFNDETPWVLHNINLVIPKGSRIGFMGKTGSGKSTTLDLLMGLLVPTQGGIWIDKQLLTEPLTRSWQKAIAHVPQSIYLADTSLAENIALGIRKKDIDHERVRQAAKQAQLMDFIEGLPTGYNTVVGERGVRLSGGQRQRIGIARALYRRATILVLDEATSALDSTTENAVTDAIESLNKDLTILVVAHRLTTLSQCTMIVELDQGQIVAQGTYEQLISQTAQTSRTHSQDLNRQ